MRLVFCLGGGYCEYNTVLCVRLMPAAVDQDKCQCQRQRQRCKRFINARLILNCNSNRSPMVYGKSGRQIVDLFRHALELERRGRDFESPNFEAFDFWLPFILCSRCIISA